jgi:hypothetical protein
VDVPEPSGGVSSPTMPEADDSLLFVIPLFIASRRSHG